MISINLKTAKNLDAAPFQRFLDDTLGKEHFYIFVYAPWCDHCKKMKPRLQAAVRRLNKTQPKTQQLSTTLLMISEDAYHHLRHYHPKLLGATTLGRVQGYPTLMRVSKAKRPTEYRGDRLTDTIEEFIKV